MSYTEEIAKKTARKRSVYDEETYAEEVLDEKEYETHIYNNQIISNSLVSNSFVTDNETAVTEDDGLDDSETKKFYTDEKILYKLWLNIICSHNPKVIYKCLNTCGDAEEIYKSDAVFNRMLKCLPAGLRLKVSRSLDAAECLLKECEEKEISLITIDDPTYPKRLSEVYMPPVILYVKGELPDIDSLVCVTVVGSRHCTDSGREFANTLAYDLAKEGVLIIGGMAEGIDSAAHAGAMTAGHKTVAVLAGGSDVIYPKSGEDLYYEICNCGAVISERPPGTIGKGYFYKERNRIMVGLSNGTVITEGEEHSGTKLTANWTTDSNRDLFAVPGKPGDRFSALPNSLIKDSAKLVTSAEDIIEEYADVYEEELEYGRSLLDSKREEHFEKRGFGDVAAAVRRAKSRKEKTEKEKTKSGRKPREVTLKPIKPDFSEFDEKQRIILDYLYNNNQAVHIDDISYDCGIDMSELSFLIIQLEMARVISRAAGDHYRLT